MKGTKPFNISKNAFFEAFTDVKKNRGTYGIDKQSIDEYEMNLVNNLYKLWNRMPSGTYFPSAVRAVPIPKKNGGTRILGIPTVEDRVAQTVVRYYFEPKVERIFLDDSYGYRPNKSAIQAIEVTRKRCWKYNWVLEYDIKGLFDNIPHEALIKLVEMHTKEKWIIMLIKRWLKVPFITKDGKIIERTSGTPQGGVISPVLANLFMHYAFDMFMTREFPNIPWARYADDGLAHCVSYEQAKHLMKCLEKRFKLCGIEMNIEKTKIVYCKDSDRTGNFENTTFDFLGYTFRPRASKSKYGKYFTNFTPAIADKAKKKMRQEVKRWKMQFKNNVNINELSLMYNNKIQGWINYYSHFYKSEMYDTLRYINQKLLKWVRRKYKNCTSKKKAVNWLRTVASRETRLFAHWKLGLLPTA